MQVLGIRFCSVTPEAEALAESAGRHGLDPSAPLDAHGERVYFIEAPSGLQVSFQSRLTPSAE